MDDALPVVFLAFANDASRKLNLGQEKDSIRRSLRAAEDQRLLRVWDIADASLDRLAGELGVYRDRLALFHYGGHAGGAGLSLREGDGNAMAFAEGLAALLATTPVKFVFLNGCGTRPQVKALHAAGIKAVLATSVPIEDTSATEFAEQFYAALARGQSLGDAFTFANAFLMARHGAAAGIVTRGDAVDDENNAAAEQTAWGLYLAAGGDSVLEWTPCPPAAIQLGAGSIDASAGSNTIIRTRLASALKSLGDKDLARAITQAERDPRDPDAAVVEAIINAFPLPMGEQLRILFIRKLPDAARLAQILRTADVAMQLVGYAALAQLWDARAAAGDALVIDPAHRVGLNSFMALSASTLASFDHYQLTVETLQILADNRIEPFMPQCADVLLALTDAESTAAHAALAQLHRQPLPADGDASLPALCREATAHLAELLCDLAFIALYKATTIRAIAVQRYRLGQPTFQHKAIPLDGAVLSSEVQELNYTDFTDSASVVLQRERDEFSPFLNLTPLVIDESAFSGGRVPNLFFFSHFGAGDDPDDPPLVFAQISNPATTITIPNAAGRWQHLAPVRRMFRDFRRTVFGA